MSASNRVKVRMNFGNGTSISDWISFSLRDTYTDPLQEMTFQAAPTPPNREDYAEQLKKGRLVTIYVDEVNHGGFLITRVRTTISKGGGFVYDLTCKTPLVTPYEGSVNPELQISTQTDTPITSIVDKALAPYGFTSIIGDEASNVSILTGRPIKGGRAKIVVDALKQAEAKAQEGETAYQFVSRLLSRVGACLRMASTGELLITNPDYEQQSSYALVQDPTRQVAGDYFTGDIVIEDTNDGQFSECRVRGQRDESAGSTQTARPDVTVKATDINKYYPAYLGEQAGYKPKILRDKNARDVNRCKVVAQLALGLPAKDAYTITGEVDGFKAKTGALWQVNTAVDVYIDADGIREKMWILERTFTQDKSGGQRTKIKLLRLGTLRLGDLPK